MAVSQPPISEDIVESSWQYEVTRNVNELDFLLQSLIPTSGPEFPIGPVHGAEHYLTAVSEDADPVGWYKYNADVTNTGWIQIS